MVLSAYYQPNRPHWDVPHICSVLHSHCSLSPTHSFRSMLTPTVIVIYNLAFPVLLFIVHSFTLALIFTHLSPFSTPPPSSSSSLSLWLCGSCSVVPLASLSFPPSASFSSRSALLLSLPPSSIPPSLLLLAAGVFSVYFAYAACFPPTASLYMCLLSETHEDS